VVAVALPEPLFVVSEQREADTHFALFQKYRCGTSRRAGLPWMSSSGSPSTSHTTHARPSVTSSIGRFVV
jgi:hypothetical protein